MAIPDFREDGWLPEGHHPASWDEVVSRFSGKPGSHRAQVMRRLLAWRNKAKEKGISGRLILDGGFISNKPNPKDFDAIFLYEASSSEILEGDIEAKQLLDYSTCLEMGFDMLAFPSSAALEYPEWVHLDAFDRDKVTGKLKGVLEVVL